MPVNRLPKASPATGGEFKALDIVKPDTGNAQVGAIGDLLGAANRLGTTVAGLVGDINKLNEKKRNLEDTNSAILASQQFVAEMSQFEAEENAKGVEAGKDYYTKWQDKLDQANINAAKDLSEEAYTKYLQLTQGEKEKGSTKAAQIQAQYPLKRAGYILEQSNADLQLKVGTGQMDNPTLFERLKQSKMMHDEYGKFIGPDAANTLYQKQADLAISQQAMKIEDALGIEDATKFMDDAKKMGYMTQDSYDKVEKKLGEIDKAKIAQAKKEQVGYNSKLVSDAIYTIDNISIPEAKKMLLRFEERAKNDTRQPIRNPEFVQGSTIAQIRRLIAQAEGDADAKGKPRPTKGQREKYLELEDMIITYQEVTVEDIDAAYKSKLLTTEDRNKLDKLLVKRDFGTSPVDKEAAKSFTDSVEQYAIMAAPKTKEGLKMAAGFKKYALRMYNTTENKAGLNLDNLWSVYSIATAKSTDFEATQTFKKTTGIGKPEPTKAQVGGAQAQVGQEVQGETVKQTKQQQIIQDKKRIKAESDFEIQWSALPEPERKARASKKQAYKDAFINKRLAK